MSTSKYFDRICAIVLAIALVLTVLFMNGQALGITLVVDADSETHSDEEYYTENDQLSDWDTSSATQITLDGDSITVKGNNAYEYDGNLVISNSGRYVISGTLDDGYITVNANENSKVWILFQGVDISCSDNACLRVDEADKVFLTLAEGTDNMLTGGEELSEEALEDGTYGVIFAHDDLTINGSGALNIQAGYKHGIKANDDLVITGGTITIDAPADGIHVNDSFRFKDASLFVTAGDDGILTENEASFFYMESGDITVDAEGDGIHSSGDFILSGGTITMDAGDDGIHADANADIIDGVITINSCYEGIEAIIVTISGGDITIYPVDDGINANGGRGTGKMFGGGPAQGNMGAMAPGMQPDEMESSLEEGTWPSDMQAPADGAQPPQMPEMEDGAQPPQMPEMGDGAQPSVEDDELSSENFAGEDIEPAEQSAAKDGGQPAAKEEEQSSQLPENGQYSESDTRPEPPAGMRGMKSGENAGGFQGSFPAQIPGTEGETYTDGEAGERSEKSREMEAGERSETSRETQEEVETYIRISGGTITIINENGNDADGLDSNGSISITGGDIRVSLSDNGMNCAIDAATENGGIVEISGGTVIACGSSSMAEGFDPSSTQCSILYNIASGMESGTQLSLENAEGETILSWDVPCSFSSVVISCPEMETDIAYTIVAGDSEETITLTEVSASFGDAQSSMFGGNMNWGGIS